MRQMKETFDFAAKLEQAASEILTKGLPDSLVETNLLAALSENATYAYIRGNGTSNPNISGTNAWKNYQQEIMEKFPQVKVVEYRNNHCSQPEIFFWLKEPTTGRKVARFFSFLDGGPR
jgi:hypothetical protein